MPTLEDRAAALSAETEAALRQLLILGTPEQSVAAKKVLDDRALVGLNAAMATFGEGTRRLTKLSADLGAVIEAVKRNPVGDALGKVTGYLVETESLLAELVRIEGTAAASSDATMPAAAENEPPSATSASDPS